jgi:hypothetical protein
VFTFSGLVDNLVVLHYRPETRLLQHHLLELDLVRELLRALLLADIGLHQARTVREAHLDYLGYRQDCVVMTGFLRTAMVRNSSNTHGTQGVQPVCILDESQSWIILGFDPSGFVQLPRECDLQAAELRTFGPGEVERS